MSGWKTIVGLTKLAIIVCVVSCSPTVPLTGPEDASLATRVAETMAVYIQPTERPTAAPSVSPQPVSDRFLWMCDTCGGDRIWVFGDGDPHQQELPVRIGKYYGWDPTTDRILFSENTPTHGAGPGNVSVAGLAVLNLSDGTVTTIFEDNIIEATWVPLRGGMAYITATPDTYELRWRSPAGDDYLLALDVTFTWSVAPSGEAVAFTRESGYEIDIDPGLYVVSIATGEEIKLSGIDKQGTGSISDQPFWSWDSSQVILSHYGGPDPPRLVWAMSDGSETFDLHIDPAFQEQSWYTNSVPYILWHPDGVHFIGVPGMGQEGLGGLIPLVVYRIDREARLLAGALIHDGVQQVIGWATPGRTLWVRALDEYHELLIP